MARTPWFAVAAGGAWRPWRPRCARPPPLQSHFVPVQHLWWHLSPFLPDRVLAVLTHREAQVVATRQEEEELRTTTWVVAVHLPNGTDLPFPGNFQEGVILKFLVIGDYPDEEVVSISSDGGWSTEG